jgi:hypothetical protein
MRYTAANLFLLASLACPAGARAQADTVHLVCKGRAIDLSNGHERGQFEFHEDFPVSIKLTPSTRRLETWVLHAAVDAPYQEVGETHYRATLNLGSSPSVIRGRKLTGVEVNLNRLTGEAFIMYKWAGFPDRLAFDGECKRRNVQF